MAPRKGGAAVPEPQGTSLQFNQPLSWRAGKPIATGELLKRLDALSDELREMDQEEVEKDSLTKVAKELAGQNLLGHKDKGVRAFTACCLADILKICAPDAPFTGTQLKDIFTLFITSILPALSDPSNAYNTQHRYVLLSLSEVKSIVLLLDIPNSEALTLHLFSSFFDIISGSTKASTGEQISKDVEYHMSQILVTVVDEAANLPTQVVDVIVAQFLRASSSGRGRGKTNADTDERQSTLLPKELPEAYNMAKAICNACPEKMARYISQYFNDVIMDASASSGPSKSNGHRRTSEAAESDDDEDEVPSGPTEADFKELQKAHKLLCELWRASPSVLQNVIPQLEAELSADSIQLRLLATETLGDIISGIGAAGPPAPTVMDPSTYPPVRLSDMPAAPISTSVLTTPLSPQSFAQTHHSSYQNFVGRKNDKSSVIRSGWTTAVGRILVTSAGGIGLSREDETALVKGLGEKLNDADEKVRIAAIKAIGTFSFSDIMAKLAPNGGVGKSGSVLNSLSDRVRDRRHAVQVEGMTTLSKMWGVASGEIAAGNESVITALGAIPTKIFDAYYANDLELNVLLDHVMFEQLIPLNYPPTKAKTSKANGESQTQSNGEGPFDPDKIRAERILLVVKSLDAKSKKAFFAIQARQSTFKKVMGLFLGFCEDYNGGVVTGNLAEVKNKLDSTIKWLKDLLPDPMKTTLDLNKYAKMHDRRSYQLIRFAMEPKSDFKTVYKAIKEFSKRVEAAPAGSSSIMDTLLPIIYRSALLLYNKSHVPPIMQISRNDENGLGAVAQEVLKEISERNPETFSSQIKEICNLIEDQAPSATKENDPSSVETLKICAGFAQTSPQDIPKNRKLTDALIKFALHGTPAKAGKYAVQILMSVSDKKEMHSNDLLGKTASNWVYGERTFLTKLATISQLSLLNYSITEEVSDQILDITTTQILLQVRTPAQETDKSWQDDADLDEECEAKCWALKILVNRLRATKEAEVAKVIAGPVYKLLNAFVFKSGEITKSKNTPKHHMSRLRLLAAQLMLKLCRQKVFDDLLTPVEFDRVAFVTQDPLATVRRGFIEKLQKYLVKDKLPHRFYTIIFLTAFEPEFELKNSIITWIRSRAKSFQDKKANVMEITFARLLSLLAHHPDFNAAADDLKDHAQYILHYLISVANENNLALIYKYAERVKQARDGVHPTESDNLYVMSDLAQTLIRKWEEKKGWSMQAWPGKVGLPVGLFAALPSHEVAQSIAEKQYLPEDLDGVLDTLVRNADKKKKRRSDDRDDAHPPSKKQRADRTKLASRPSVKKDRPTKPKTPAKPKKAKRSPTSTPIDSANRRRSGRGTASKTTYVDRDSSEDDEEMLDGVAQWEYLDKNVESGSENENEESDAEEKQDASMGDAGEDAKEAAESEKEEEEQQEEEDAEVEAEPEAASEPEDHSEAESVPEPEAEPESEAEPTPEPEPTPPRSNGRPKRGAAPLPKPKGKVKAKPKPKVQAVRVAPRATRGRGKVAKSDVLVGDESD
ncbi:spo76 protein [Phlyctema vagabunda]|uniref:Spo76 protein n=1 Tax=Phlyctema vagabunda TaxID=108571 RepID=A0ABR4P7I4_9HELO